MPRKSWDPLKEKFSAELLGAVIKRQIKNILKSYTGWYDPLSEMIQNALDAVEQRKEKSKKGYKSKIWITIDLSKNSISVTDNGIGFNEDEFRSFLAPNVSFKGGKTRGNKGVGATYLAYGFNYLQIGTKKDDFKFVGVIKRGREWVEDEKNRITRPVIQKDKFLHKYFKQIDQGSTFVLSLEGEHIRPKELKYVGANSSKQWEAILKIKTPLGGIYLDDKCKVDECYLEVIDEKGKSSMKKIEDLNYLFPHTVISSCMCLDKIIEKNKELGKKERPIKKFPSSFYKLNGLYQIWHPKDILFGKWGLKVKLEKAEEELIKQYKPSMYGFQCYSTNIWDSIDEGLKLRKGTRILKGGLQLATSRMAQGDLQIIPLTKNIGLQNVTHVVIHFNSADPDLGRKGLQPELLKLAQKLSGASVFAFRVWKLHLKADTGAPPDIIAEKLVYDWVTEQVAHEKESPLIIKRKDVFLPLKEASLTSEPLNEQDVVSLFNQLLAGGVIRGVKILATHSSKKYDGVCRIYLKKPFSNHIFDKKNNPLGIEKTKAIKEFESPPCILEYKYDFDSLLEDFEKGDKNPKDITLIVAWNVGEEWQKRYDLVSLLSYENIQHRKFHGATHNIHDSSTGDFVFHAIFLKELINYINDPEGVQKYHKKTYLDN